MTHRMNRLALAAGAAAAAALFAAIPAFAATGLPAVATASGPVSDYWEQTHHNISIGSLGGVETMIMSLRLPAGKWVLHADQTMVNFGPSDYAGCSIGDTTNNNLNTHRVLVGNPNVSGAKGSAALVTALSETAAVSLQTPTTVTVLCAHDSTNGSSPYIDSNADLWAHRASHLVIRQLP